MVKLLLEAPGIEINATDNRGETALHHVCRGSSMDLEGRPPILRELLAFPGIDPNLKDNYGTTPIMAVLTYGNVVQQLGTGPSISRQSTGEGHCQLF